MVARVPGTDSGYEGGSRGGDERVSRGLTTGAELPEIKAAAERGLRRRMSRRRSRSDGRLSRLR